MARGPQRKWQVSSPLPSSLLNSNNQQKTTHAKRCYMVVLPVCCFWPLRQRRTVLSHTPTSLPRMVVRGFWWLSCTGNAGSPLRLLRRGLACRGRVCRGLACCGRVCRGLACRGLACRGRVCRGRVCRGLACRRLMCSVVFAAPCRYPPSKCRRAFCCWGRRSAYISIALQGTSARSQLALASGCSRLVFQAAFSCITCCSWPALCQPCSQLAL